MKHLSKLAVITGALALSAAPALAAGPPNGVPPSNQGTSHTPGNSGTSHIPSTTPGPNASLPSKAKAYGRYCKDQSKQHVAGQKGTPFSQCVTAMAKLANSGSYSGNTSNPQTACKSESKKHVAGQKGTPFSQCVSAGAKLLQDLSQSGSNG
jgi:hypothetical protein